MVEYISCEGCVRLTSERDAALAEVARLSRELERWRHGVTIEGDYVCPDSLALSEALAGLRRYGRHEKFPLKECDANKSDPHCEYPCTCGLDTAIAAITTEPAAGEGESKP